MKFEKFVKMCGTHGIVYTTKSGLKFLSMSNVFVLIPDGVNVLTTFSFNAPDMLENIIEDFAEDYTDDAQLIDAKLPTADASASKIIRVFGNFENTIAVENPIFGLIERGDTLKIDSALDCNNGDEKLDYNSFGLVITNGYQDDEHIVGIIIDSTYYREECNKAEKE